ncbi:MULTISPECIES: DUF998 domain-containing protein [Dyella]|nr:MULTISPECIES: DUF998 domain-containing protein [Dyella]
MHPTRLRLASLFLLSASAYFALVAGILQWTRSDLDPVAIPLSPYLVGPGGAWLRSAYYAMALAILCMAVAGYRATMPASRSLLAAILFGGAGLALPVVAVTELYLGTPHESAAQLIHGLAAQATFLWLSFAMLLVSGRWRRDPRLQRGSATGVALAWLATAALWSMVFARSLPHGLMQKLTIALVLLWMCWAVRQLWRTTQDPADAQSAR